MSGGSLVNALPIHDASILLNQVLVEVGGRAQHGILAKRTPGFTGADLANLINEAALLTVRRNKTQIGMNELEESIERVLAGPEKKNCLVNIV